MDSAYQPEAWHDFYIMVGGASAALTGLIFVAVSIHLRPVLRNHWHRGRAGSSLLALMSVVLISGAVLIPGQPLEALGTEVIAIALLSPVYTLLGAIHLPREQRVAAVLELLVGAISATLAVLGGLSLMTRWGGGLWLLLPGAAIALGSSVWNAWRLLVDVAAEHQS